jgi:hypothetical protein
MPLQCHSERSEESHTFLNFSSDIYITSLNFTLGYAHRILTSHYQAMLTKSNL